MLGAGAGEVLAVVQTAMLGGLRCAVRDEIFTHPTMIEELNALLASIPDANALPAARALARWKSERGRVRRHERT